MTIEIKNTEIITGMDQSYPNFNSWLSNLKQGTETPILKAYNKDKLIGICIGKDTPEEKKIRLVRIHPDFVFKGIGIKLIDEMMEVLKTDKPHCTVPEEQLHMYSRLFINRYKFSLDNVHKGLYRKGKLEYMFNC